MLTTRSYILSSVDYGESDRIFTLYTRESGRMSAIARGARKSRKRFGGALEPFAEFEAVLTPSRGRGQLHQISESTLLDAHFGLCQNLDRMTEAARLITFVREATPEGEADSGLFDHLAKGLRLLDKVPDAQANMVALHFGFAVLFHSGLSISVNGCTACGKAIPTGKSAWFDPGRGGVVCTACGGGPILLSAGAVHGLQQLYLVDIEDAGATSVPPEHMSQMENAFLTFYKYHVQAIKFGKSARNR